MPVGYKGWFDAGGVIKVDLMPVGYRGWFDASGL